MSHLDLGPPPPAKGLQRPNGQYTVHIWEDIVFEEWVIGFVERFEHCQVIASIVCISLGIKQIGAVAFISILQKFAIYFVPMRQQETKVGGLRTAVAPALLLVYFIYFCFVFGTLSGSGKGVALDGVCGLGLLLQVVFKHDQSHRVRLVHVERSVHYRRLLQTHKPSVKMLSLLTKPKLPGKAGLCDEGNKSATVREDLFEEEELYR